MITTLCYGMVKKWDNREDAISFFYDLWMDNVDSPISYGYHTIWNELKNSDMILISDSPFINEQIKCGKAKKLSDYRFLIHHPSTSQLDFIVDVSTGEIERL